MLLDALLQLVWKSYGLVGFLLLLPVAACVLLWKQNLSLHKQISEHMRLVLDAQKLRAEDQTTRVDDYERMTEKLVEIVREQTALNTEANGLMTRMSEALERLERHILYNGRG